MMEFEFNVLNKDIESYINRMVDLFETYQERNDTDNNSNNFFNKIEQHVYRVVLTAHFYEDRQLPNRDLTKNYITMIKEVPSKYSSNIEIKNLSDDIIAGSLIRIHNFNNELKKAVEKIDYSLQQPGYIKDKF